ncbi:Crp/Fnr family transcriptional regulator [Fodinibius salsisoli]|uniref:Crp/Fnr family transcriptional regulator n=1 Tax=Fodinibius salsisoli TaxID=2820877 RepID=A0ABT3PKE0_9BACT|nr:Crp/Fnr family transcriptional regulator [Fodinibius salsisoli]MCW9705669.1 Crp/Fnr family transcriptional regulator [Fodinibius salsisoli]
MHDFLKSLGILTDLEIEELSTYSHPRTLEKNEFLIREDSICQEVAFIKKGIMRSFYTDENGEEITYCITFSKNFMTAYSSLITGNPTPENIQAITQTELRIIRNGDIQKLTDKSANWLKLQKFFAEQEYLELEKRIFAFQKENARQRYIDLMQEHPKYIQQIPLQYLASYLGISQRHLSRIRKDLAF